MSASRADLCIEPGSPSWPQELEHIEPPPERLWLRGECELLRREPRVAIVGTRAPTPYGAAQAARFGRELAAAGVSVVSGLARGIDQCAHRAALEARGTTLAVLGSGIDQPWPRGALTDELCEKGLLLSEFEPGERPRARNFPLRNRLISGLARAVVVIEAAHASGSLITARWAADQGRDVFALPGRVDHPMARGTHRLLREGASLVESPQEILSELGLAQDHTPESKCSRPGPERSPLLAALQGETLTADELAERVGQGIAVVLTELVRLELAERVVRGPGGLYRLS